MATGARPVRSSQPATWHSAGPGRVGLLRATYVRQDFPRHFHDTFVVCVNERGAHQSWYRGGNVVIPAGAVTIVPPGEIHTGRPVPGHPWHYRAMYPDPDLLATLAGELGQGGAAIPSFGALVVDDPRLAAAFVGAHRGCEAEEDALQREGRVAEVLLALLRRHSTARRRRAERPPLGPPVRRATEFIRECFAERLTLDRLAEAAGVSRYAVLRAFRREVGIAPYSYVIQVRIEEASRLLRSGVPVAAVSQGVGFADQSHLTRHFRRIVGVTPGVYARGTRPAAPIVQSRRGGRS